MKKDTKLGIWEVWNEYAAESVYVDHNPTWKDIEEIIKKEKWPGPESFTHIYINKLKVYSGFSEPKKKPRKEADDKCGYCGGAGGKSDDSYSYSKCHWCNGTGKKNGGK